MNLLDRLDIINRNLSSIHCCCASELRAEKRRIQDTLDTMGIEYYNRYEPLEEL